MMICIMASVIVLAADGDEMSPGGVMQVLQDSLCGSSKVMLVCNLAPEAASGTETQSSLNFASRAAQVQSSAVASLAECSFIRVLPWSWLHSLRAGCVCQPRLLLMGVAPAERLQ